MNRIILIGNGFDLAHGLPTSYKDFIVWYWAQFMGQLGKCEGCEYNDGLCYIKLKNDYHTLADYVGNPNSIVYNADPFVLVQNLEKESNCFDVFITPLLQRICGDLSEKNWVDIENVYYKMLKESLQGVDVYKFTSADLNRWLQLIQNKLVEYLGTLSTNAFPISNEFRQIFYGGIKKSDVAIAFNTQYLNHAKYCASQPIQSLKRILKSAGLEAINAQLTIGDFQRRFGKEQKDGTFIYDNFNIDEFPDLFAFPQRVLILSFNYTPTAKKYMKEDDCDLNYIHGNLDSPKSVLFGFGDELDDDYKYIIDKGDNELLKNFKSIRYLESDNYRKMLSFLEADTFQVVILGHSCGNSDRTLLNTIFEHPNCASIKPYYYEHHKTDNYMEIVQSIYRNFTDMKLMRDRVVNKKYCNKIPQIFICKE